MNLYDLNLVSLFGASSTWSWLHARFWCDSYEYNWRDFQATNSILLLSFFATEAGNITHGRNHMKYVLMREKILAGYFWIFQSLFAVFSMIYVISFMNACHSETSHLFFTSKITDFTSSRIHFYSILLLSVTSSHKSESVKYTNSVDFCIFLRKRLTLQ